MHNNNQKLQKLKEMSWVQQPTIWNNPQAQKNEAHNNNKQC
jgi:hypothetical protein